MGVKIISDDTIIERISPELSISTVSGNSYIIKENGEDILGTFEGVVLFLLDTTRIFIYHNGLWYEQ